MSSEAAVFIRLHRVPVCSEAELLIFIMTAKCKFTGEEKLLIISPYRKENFPNENFWGLLSLAVVFQVSTAIVNPNL